MFDCHTQSLEIHIIELFIVLEESHFSSSGSAPNPTHVGMSQPKHSSTFIVASHMLNKNVWTKNVEDLIGGPSFRQLATHIVEPFLQDGPIAGYDFIIDHGDDEEEPAEVPFDSGSDEGSDGVAEPVTQSQPSMTQSQFQFQSHLSKLYSMNATSLILIIHMQCTITMLCNKMMLN